MATTEVQNIMPAAPEAEGLNLTEYLGVFQRRPKTIVLPMIALTMIAGIIAYVIPPQYETFTRFKIRDPGLLKDVLGMTQAIMPHKPLLATIDADVKRKPFLEPIVDKIGLTEGFNLRDPEELNEFYAVVFQNLNIAKSNNKIGADVFTISYRGRDRNKIVEFLDLVRDNYYADFRKEYRAMALGVFEKAKLRKREVERELAELTAEYDAFRNGDDYRLIGIASDRTRELFGLRDDERELRLELRKLEGQLKGVEAQIREQDTEEVRFNLVPNAKKEAAKTELETLKTNLNDLVVVKGFTDLVPGVKELKQKIAEKEAALREMPDVIRDSSTVGPNSTFQSLLDKRLDFQRQLQGQQDAFTQVTNRIADIEKEIDRIPDLSTRDLAFKQDLSLLNDKVRDANRKFARIDDTWARVRGKGSNLFEVLDWPENSNPPVFPSIPLFLGLGAAAGLLLGIGVAFLKEFSGMTYMTASQVQSRLPLPILGEVSRIKTAEEEKAERSRRVRYIVVITAVLALIAFLHICYFNEEFTDILPPFVADFMDVIYKGRR